MKGTLKKLRENKDFKKNTIIIRHEVDVLATALASNIEDKTDERCLTTPTNILIKILLG